MDKYLIRVSSSPPQQAKQQQQQQHEPQPTSTTVAPPSLTSSSPTKTVVQTNKISPATMTTEQHRDGSSEKESPHQVAAVSSSSSSSPPNTQHHHARILETMEEGDSNKRVKLSKDELGVRVFRTGHCPQGGTLKLARGSVVSFRGDCIVNATNEQGITGGGVDGAINAAGGEKLLQARRALPIVTGDIRIPRGHARITPAFGSLACSRVVHVVSADYNDETETQDELDKIVRRAYRHAMRAAKNANTVAFSLLSAGIYRGNRDLDEILNLGVETIKECIIPNQTVYLVAFTEAERDALIRVFQRHFVE